MPDNEIKLKLIIDGKEALTSISLTDNELKKTCLNKRDCKIICVNELLSYSKSLNLSLK